LEHLIGPALQLVRLAHGAAANQLGAAFHPSAGPPLLDSAEECTPISGADAEGDGERHLKPARVCLFREGSESLAALEGVLAGATRRIDVLIFEWSNDAVGAAIAHLIAAKAGPELRVRILVDGGGNLLFGTPTPENGGDVNRLVKELAHTPYVEVIRARDPFGRFDHRKLIVVDGRVAWTGGRNLTERAFFGQHDLSLTVAGPLVADLQACFDAAWRHEGGQPLPANGGAEAAGDCAEAVEVNAQGRLVQTRPLRHQIEHALYAAVDGARHHLYLENFTFADGTLIAKFARARRRQVDVRVVLTLANSTPVINRANRVMANRLLAAGVRVYVFPEMTHVKGATADGNWAYLGSGNFDPLSLRWNRELGLVASGPCPLVTDVEARLFAADFRPEWELKQPLPVGVMDYLAEALAAAFL
jgi:cardiolipin synthase